MAIPATPTSFYLQQGNAQCFLSWDIQAGATSYDVQRSTDGVSFSSIATPAVNYYLDTTVTVGTLYYYQVASVNLSGTSSFTVSQSIVPTRTADLSLSQVRLMAKQRADRVGSNFVTLPEWNSYINQSYFELYDLLVTSYEDYYVQTPYEFVTDGTTVQYPLPTDLYKVLGVDYGLSGSNDAFVTLQKFDFINRNKYIYPQLTANFLGVFNPSYRLIGDTIMFIPTASAGQTIRVWYIPKMTQLLQDTDILTGISGWSEYVIVDAAIKALQKEESDVSVLMAQKMQLLKRIEESAMNRDAGAPDTISDSRANLGRAEAWGGPFGGPWGGI